MASYELTGILKVKGETQKVSDSFYKREFVIVEDPNGQYPQFIQLQLTQNNCDRLDRFNVGDEVTVKFNIRGREWKNPQKEGETKYFNSLDAWTVLHPNEDGSRPVPESFKPIQSDTSTEIAEDLPF